MMSKIAAGSKSSIDGRLMAFIARILAG